MRKRLTGILVCVALVSVIFAGIRPASAYFTTYAEAKGMRTIHLGDVTRITEEFKDWKKEVKITNNSKSAKPVYIRVRAIAGSAYPLEYPVTDGWTKGEGWEDGKDGWWGYGTPVLPGKATDLLTVEIKDVPVTPEVGDSFNVIIVYESTPAVENGTQMIDGQEVTIYEPADWNREVTTQIVSGEEGE